MKTSFVLRLYAVTIIAASLSMLSCKKSSDGLSANTGNFYFRLQTNIDSNIVTDTAALYEDSLGRHFSLTVAQFFIYNVVLQNVNGSTYTIGDAYILKDIDSQQYIIGSAPAGNYNSVTFNVGLDAGTNAISPGIFTPAGSYISTATMWYGSSTYGYMFMFLQGFADTTATQNGTSLLPFSYAIASAANLKTVTMPVRGTGSYSSYPVYSLSNGGNQYIDIICDYGKLLSMVNFKTQDSADSYYFDPALADSIANNIPNMFRYAN